MNDLDETTALIVRELRAVDPVLRELHVNTSRVDALEASERASRRMQAEMVQTLKELELAASFMLAWTTAEGSTGVASWKPGTMNLLNHSSKAARDRLQRLTKSDMVALKKIQGRPF